MKKNWFRDLPLQFKLYSGFFCLIIIFVTAIVYFEYSFQKIETSSTEISQRYTLLENLILLENYAEDLSSAADSFLHTQEDKWETAYDEISLNFDHILQDYKDFETDKLALATIQSVKKSANLIKGTELLILLKVRQGKLQEAEALFDGSYISSYQKIINALQDLRTKKQKEIEDILQQNVVFITKSSRVSIISIFVSIVLATLISYAIVSSVISFLRHLTKTAESFSSGNLSKRTKITSNDELGVLSKTFNVMAQKLEKSYRQLKKQAQEVATTLEKTKLQNEDLQNTKRATLNILQDVEEERQKARSEAEKIDAIVQSIGDGVFVINKNWEIILFNTTAETISGFSQKETIGKRYDSILKFIHEDTKEPNMEFVQNAMLLGKNQKMANHTVLIHKDGHEIPVADSSAPLKNEEGDIIGCVVVFRDVTSERELETMKNEFMSIASHQLRTPLGIIRWNLEFLSENIKEYSPRVASVVEDMGKNTKRLIRLVNDLLNVSRIEEKKTQEEIELVDSAQIVEKVTKAVQALAKERNIALNISTPQQELPSVKANTGQLYEILENLLSNAVKYTPEKGKVAVTVETKGGNILFHIVDTGIGIPKKDQEKMFGKFFRAENVVQSDATGSGLGLYVARLYARQWGGDISFTSIENKGSTFTLKVPLA